MKIDEYRLEAGDKNYINVFSPDEISKPLPVLIHCHGWGAGGEHYLDDPLCIELAKSSVINVKVDFYGSGSTGGDYSGMSYGRWASNLNDTYTWIKEQPWANANKIGLYGASSGTTAALRFAIEYATPSFVISCATALGLYIGMPNGPGKILIDNFEALCNGSTAKVFGTDFKIDFFKDFIGAQPIYRMHEIKCPVYFVEGSADNIFRRTDGMIGHQIMKSYNLLSDYIEVEGADHGFGNMEMKKVELFIDYLKKMQFINEGYAI